VCVKQIDLEAETAATRKVVAGTIARTGRAVQFSPARRGSQQTRKLAAAFRPRPGGLSLPACERQDVFQSAGAVGQRNAASGVPCRRGVTSLDATARNLRCVSVPSPGILFFGAVAKAAPFLCGAVG